MIIVPVEKKFDWRHTPVVLFLIVIINILVLFLYQSGDDSKIYDALDIYQDHNLLEVDWPIYSHWLEEGKTDELDYSRDLYSNNALDQLAVTILLDTKFYNWQSKQPKPPRITVDDYLDDSFEKNNRAREQAHKKVGSISSLAHGLIASDLKITSLLTYQFLHGGVMHLMSNLFFLVICGFAVEAALGHLRFLAFYLLGGIGAGLAYASMDWGSSTPLVGASGSISAVMAMYLVVFRFKKIEFFYWFFFFVGYLRAPAMLILPFYIGKEIYSFYNNTDSNIAFMAHTGGFITGAVLILGAVAINRNMLNQDYLEEDQSTDPKREKLDKVYVAIENFNFKIANDTLVELIKEYGLNFDYALLRLNIFNLVRSKNIKNCVLDIFNLKNVKPEDLPRLESLWQSYSSYGSELSQEVRIGLATRLADLPTPRVAESIFLDLKENGCELQDMKLLATKLQNARNNSVR